MEDTNKQNLKPIEIGVGAVVILILFMILKPFTVIGAGQRGVVMHFGKVQNEILGEGLHFYIPIYTGIQKVDVRVRKDDVKAEAASQDLQTVTVDIVVNWHPDSSKVNTIYQTVGSNTDMVNNIISPAINEVVKATTAQKTAEEIITKRPELKAEIDSSLIQRLTPYGIILNDVSLVNVDFSKEFNDAIEKKQVAEQQSKQAQFTAEKAVKDAEAIVNKAKGDAEAQRLQQETLSPLLLQKMAIDKWDGRLPNYMPANGQVLFNIPTQ